MAAPAPQTSPALRAAGPSWSSAFQGLFRSGLGLQFKSCFWMAHVPLKAYDKLSELGVAVVPWEGRYGSLVVSLVNNLG